MQIDSFMELPEEKRPPKSMWNDPDKLSNWFDRIFKRGEKSNLEFDIDDIEE